MFKPIWLIIAKWGAIAIGTLFVIFKIRQSGKDVVVQQNMQETIEGIKVRDKVENDIASADDAEYERLRQKWTK